MSYIHTETDLEAALARLVAADPRLAALLQVAGTAAAATTAGRL